MKERSFPLATNKSLQKLNTFGIEVKCDQYDEFNSREELSELLEKIEKENLKTLVLGGGSNILFKNDFHGIVIRNRISGKKIIEQSEEYVILESGAGENWHELVLFCVANNWGGAENLSLIPGCTGAGPMQNIGAYGVELKDFFYGLDAMNIKTGEIKHFTKADCKFGYRESVFKNIYKGEYIILSVYLKLTLPPYHQINTGYGAIKDELNDMNISDPGIKDVSNAVCNIRRSKLPDPEKLGNAGSFFKNPVISKEKFEEIKSIHPEIVNYPFGDEVKLAAGWLIEKSGWKGKRIGNTGIHEKQALVIVNYGKATGQEIYDLSELVLNDVEEKFDVRLEREVNII